MRSSRGRAHLVHNELMGSTQLRGLARGVGGRKHGQITTYYFTACSLDGFIATEGHSLDWPFRQQVHEDGPMAYRGFEKSIGAFTMGASTYE